MSINALLGVLLFVAILVLAILYNHAQGFDGTAIDMLSAIGAFFGAREALAGWRQT